MLTFSFSVDVDGESTLENMISVYIDTMNYPMAGHLLWSSTGAHSGAKKPILAVPPGTYHLVVEGQLGEF